MRYVTAHMLHSGPSSNHKLFLSHYGTPCMYLFFYAKIPNWSLGGSEEYTLGTNIAQLVSSLIQGNYWGFTTQDILVAVVTSCHSQSGR